MEGLEELSIGKVMVECARRNIQGYTGKPKLELIKMIEKHDAALKGSEPKKKEEIVEETIEEESSDVVIEDDEEFPEPKFDDSDGDGEVVEIDTGSETTDESDDSEPEIETPKPKESAMAGKAKAKVKAEKAKKPAAKKDDKGRGRVAIDKEKLYKETGSPFKAMTNSDVFFRLLKKGGTKESIVKAATATFAKKEIKCGNPDSRFDRILTAINSGNAGVNLKVVKDEKGRYSIK